LTHWLVGLNDAFNFKNKKFKKEGKMEGNFFEKGWVETLAINGPLNL
jgi:hypothetical protein